MWKPESKYTVSVSGSKKWSNVYCKRDPRKIGGFLVRRLSQSVQTNKEANGVTAPIFLTRASPRHLSSV